MATLTVREFVKQMYRSITANAPTVPLHGDDQKEAIVILNQLLKYYSANGLLLTITKQISYALTANQQTVTFGEAAAVPAPDVAEGKLTNINEAWLELDNVTYPLQVVDEAVFYGQNIYAPLSGLPQYCILLPDNNINTLRLYPAPSQQYTLNVRGKFSKEDVDSNDSLDALPPYYYRFLLLACARDVCIYKGRLTAWTEQLENLYTEAKKEMESASKINMSLIEPDDTMLNGANRVRAGV